jgi:hypothetical protein
MCSIYLESLTALLRDLGGELLRDKLHPPSPFGYLDLIVV